MKFSFWKNNLIENHFQLTPEQFTEQFFVWLYTKDLAWIQYYRSDRVFMAFIGDKEGLSSVNDSGQWQAIRDSVFDRYLDVVTAMETLHKLLKEHAAKTADKPGKNGYELALDMLIEQGKDLNELIRDLVEQQLGGHNKALEDRFGKAICDQLSILPLPKPLKEV